MSLKRYMLAAMMALIIVAAICEPGAAFVDSNYHWARLQIEHLHSRGFISGYPDDTYRPDSNVSREEFVTIIIKAIHKEAEAEQLSKGDSAFDDVDEGRWSMGYIELARELSVALGNGQGLFLPANPISREEAVTMLVNCLKADIGDIYPDKISDQEQISLWAQGAVAYAWEQGLISGYPDGSFRPRANISRAELACLLEGLLAFQGDQHHFYGTLESINLPLKRLIVDLNGSEQIFEMSNNVRVYAQGGKEPLKNLNLPARAYFDLDSNGKLTFILLSQEIVHGQVNIKLQSLPDYVRTPTNSQLSLLNNNAASEISATNVLTNDPGSSLRISQDAMKVWDFRELTEASGRGQLVAVIDSGVDPGHPDLQYTKDKYSKIVDYIDLTNEGKVELDKTAQEIDDYIEVEGRKKIDVSEIYSVDGQFRYGYLNINRLPLDLAALFPTGKILLIATKSSYVDRFDSLYMDINGDGKLNDEQEMKVFSQSHQKFSIKGSGERAFNFVLTEMQRDGKIVKLGYDAEGHGTMVAGIVAANGNISGVAPDAQILPIKIANSAGTASLENLQSALLIAAERGVKIAVVSMGQAQVSDHQRQTLSELAANLWNNYGMAICVAAGNEGPGLNTVAETSALNNFISIGAYATPEMMQNDYGWTVKEPELWYFSATGPGKDGQAAPLVVAPGNVISCFPMWDYPYKLDEGSSMAAPHVAGAAALLMDAVSQKLYRSDARAVWMALLGGAEPLKGYQVAEQGYGAINLLRSWKEINNLKDDPLYYKLKEYSPEYGYGIGYFSRYLQPGKLSVTIKNPNSTSSQLAVGSLAPWIVPGQSTVQLPANSERSIDINFTELDQPGLYSSFLLADDAATPGWDVAMLQTVVVPYRLSAMPDNRVEDKNILDAGKFKRYFLAVPPECPQLDLSLIVGDKGRACMYVIAPDGSRETSSYAGLGGLVSQPEINMLYNNPLPGTWEVVVYSTVTLSSLGLESSSYTFTAALQAAGSEKFGAANKYLVSSLPGLFKVGEQTIVSLHFFNANNKQPVDDVVSINGRLYEIKAGLLQMEMIPESDVLNLNIGV